MAEFTKEQLINLARENVRVLKQAAMQHKVQPVIAMDLRLAEIALAALTAGMEQEPVIIVGDDGGDALAYRRLIQGFAPGTKLYAAPQLPQPAVAITQHFDTIALDTAKMVMCDVNRRDEFLGGDIQLLSRIQCRIDEACRAAMLQGNHRDLSYPVDPQVAEYEKIMQQAVPDGWVAVPVEPTEEILDEFDSIIDYGAEDSKDAWRRLISAAPQQEAVNG